MWKESRLYYTIYNKWRAYWPECFDKVSFGLTGHNQAPELQSKQCCNICICKTTMISCKQRKIQCGNFIWERWTAQESKFYCFIDSQDNITFPALFIDCHWGRTCTERLHMASHGNLMRRFLHFLHNVVYSPFSGLFSSTSKHNNSGTLC